MKRTIGGDLHFRGVGVHSGRVVNLALKPSDGGGIVFRRTDRDGVEIALDPGTSGMRNRTCLGSGDGRIETVEHLLAALSGFGVDSLGIELDGIEIPILDGSALPFADALAGAGTREVAGEKRILRVLKPFTVEEGGASIEVLPDPGFRISYLIEFDHPAVGRQEIDIDVTRESFAAGIAPARTFGFLKDVPELHRRGLGLGGSFQNTLLLDGEKVVNGPLRFPDEFVRHKVLDLVGDLYLVGCPVKGYFKARRAGHALHLKAVRFLLDHPDFREYVD
ncbi:MAG: UDP-3-O-acyl-N-acetylglucosamine deacetylase [Candidatus Aminicenantales bacterium]